MWTWILADNQDVTRYGMKAIVVACIPSCECVEVPDWEHLVETLRSFPESCVVLDYTLFDCTAGQLQVLHERFPQVNFILFSERLEGDFIHQMMLSGNVFHVLMKDASLDEIRRCFESVRRGCQFVCAEAQDLLKEKTKKEEEGMIPLTQTEKEILRAMSLGKSSKEIAAERFLSVYTVATHRKNIFRKLRVNNAHEAIRYALRAGIVNAVEYCI